jgi:hypothetical protein
VTNADSFAAPGIDEGGSQDEITKLVDRGVAGRSGDHRVDGVRRDADRFGLGRPRWRSRVTDAEEESAGVRGATALSREAYGARLTAADKRYSDVLDALIGALRQQP